MNMIKGMSKKSLLIGMFVAAFGLSAQAQVFVLDGDKNRQETENIIGNLEAPPTNTGQDHNMAPLGSGSLLLVALGGAYLLTKKK